MFAAAVPVKSVLDTASALAQGVAGQPDDVEGIHHRDRVGEFLGGRGLESGEPVHRDDLHGVAPGLRPLAQPLLEHLLRTALDHVQQPGWAGAVTDAGQVDDHRHVLLTTTGVAPHVLVDTDHPDAVEPAGLVDQDPLALGQDRVVGGVPRDPETHSATRATVKCWHTMPSSAHRRPRRDSFARGSAARLVSWRHTCPQPVHR